MTIYSDYLKRKSQNAIRFGYSDEYPCILKNSKGKDLKNYQISGNSIKQNKNLVPIDNLLSNKTIDGITFTAPGDGSLIANGTASANCWYIISNNIKIKNGCYTLSGCPENGGSSTYNMRIRAINDSVAVKSSYDTGNSVVFDVSSIKFSTITLVIYIAKGTTVENLVFKPQLELGKVKSDYISSVPSFDNPIEIESIGEKTKNLIPYPYTNTTITQNGVTFTDNGDGSITVEGTPTDYSAILVSNKNIPIKEGQTFTFSLNYRSDVKNIAFNIILRDENNTTIRTVAGSYYENKTFIIGTNEKSMQIIIKRAKSNEECKGTFKPMLELGEVATEYEPYNKYKIPIICRGKNVFDITKCYHYDANKKAMFIPESARRDNNEGKVKLVTNMQAGHTYIITGNSTSSSGYFVYLNGTQTVWRWGTIYTPTQADIDGSIYFYKHTESEAPEGVTDVTITDVQIEEAMTSSEYEEYQTPITTNIYLDKPLRGLPDKQDIIDFKNQKVIQNIDEVILNGTENWTSNVSSSVTHDVVLISMSKFKIGNTSKALISTGRFNPGYYNMNNYIGFTSWSQDQNVLMYRKDGITVDTMKELLQNQNTKFVGILKDPIESSIDLSKLPTLKGTTICEINSNIIPHSMSVKYIRN